MSESHLEFTQARMLHTMLRVENLDRAVASYSGQLGMRLLRQRDFPEGRCTLAFLVPRRWRRWG